MTWGSYSTALQMREIVRDIIKEEVERIRPRYQLATVQSFDRINRKCTIRYNGETSDVVVNMGSVQPSAIGQIVRIDGLLGDRYVAEVLGTAYQPLEDRVATLESDPAAAAVFNVNPSFELGLDGWSNFWATGGANAVLEVNSPDAYSGGNCVSVTLDDVGDTGIIQSAPYPVQPGEPLYVSFAVKWDGNGTQPNSKLEIMMAADEANANYFGSGVVYGVPLNDLAITSGTYQFRDAVYIVPAGVNYARFAVRVWPSAAGTEKVFIDQIRFQRLIYPDFTNPVVIDGALTANGGIGVPTLDGDEGFQGLGGMQYDILRRMGGIGLKYDGTQRSVTSTGVGWNNRFIIIGAGKNASSIPSGYMSINMPANTTSVPVNSGGGTAVTVASGLIPLGTWRALYYNPSWTENPNSDDSRWNIVDFSLGNFTVPQHWILIASRNDAGWVMWGDGYQQDYWRTPSLSNSWTDYGGSYDTIQYGLFGGRVQCKGLAGNGTVGSTTVMFNLPAGYRPAAWKVFTAQSGNSAVGRIDVQEDGDVIAYALGSASWLSLSCISFVPQQ